MKVDYAQGKAKAEKADLLVVPVLQEKKGIVGQVLELDEALKGLLSRRAATEEFSGKKDSVLAADTPSSFGSPRVMLYGLGKPEQFTTEVFRRALAKAVNHAESARASRVSIVVPEQSGIPLAALVRAGAEGALLGAYRFMKYKSENNRTEIKAVTLLGSSKKSPDVDAAIEWAQVAAEATNFVRDLVNEPAGALTPAEMAK